MTGPFALEYGHLNLGAGRQRHAPVERYDILHERPGDGSHRAKGTPLVEVFGPHSALEPDRKFCARRYPDSIACPE